MGAHGTDSGWFFWLLVGVLICVFAAHTWKDGRRRRELKECLLDLSFKPIESLDPQILAADERLRRGRVISGFDGVFNGRQAVVVDLRLGSGKHSYTQTFVVVERADSSSFVPPPIVSSLAIDYRQNDRWLVGSIPRQTMGSEAVIGYLECFT